MSPKGQSEIEFCYQGNKIKTTFLSKDERLPNVLGRGILEKLQLNWKDIFNSFVPSEVNSTSDNVTLNKIISEYKVVFSDELGTLRLYIPIDPQVIPKYFRARTVPYSLKEKIEHELERLVKLRIYRPVASSKWVAPIVPIVPRWQYSDLWRLQKDVKKAADCDKIPYPKNRRSFCYIEWGEKFTKLDLSQAYQQLLLSPYSRELLTLKIHKGFFQPTRLQFGVHSASGIFQRELENRHASIPYDVEHFNNLRKVLKIICDNGLSLKLQKCVFMQDEVVYLRFKINKNAIFPVKAQLIAIKNAEEPKLLNYYHKHFQGFTDTLEPLHNLLRKGVK